MKKGVITKAELAVAMAEYLGAVRADPSGFRDFSSVDPTQYGEDVADYIFLIVARHRRGAVRP